MKEQPTQPSELSGRRPSGRKRWSGGSMLEMVLVLPILIMLSFGVVDYGYYMYLKNTLQGAAQAGARAAIPAAATNANVTGTNGIITSMMSAAGISSSNYTVTLNPTDVSTASVGSNITVTITATWSNVGTHALPTALGGISGSKQLIGVAVMQKEN